jgi:hypothetical protein
VCDEIIELVSNKKNLSFQENLNSPLKFSSDICHNSSDYLAKKYYTPTGIDANVHIFSNEFPLLTYSPVLVQKRVQETFF